MRAKMSSDDTCRNWNMRACYHALQGVINFGSLGTVRIVLPLPQRFGDL